jgi:hypothetical protein
MLYAHCHRSEAVSIGGLLLFPVAARGHQGPAGQPLLEEGTRGMPDIEFVRGEIEHKRRQVQRQCSEIRQLQRAGIPSTSAEALLDRMLNKIDDLCAERDRLRR